jgi:hypothetical protein
MAIAWEQPESSGGQGQPTPPPAATEAGDKVTAVAVETAEKTTIGVQLESISIGGNAGLEQSPIGAQTVNYIYHGHGSIGTGDAESDPSIAIELKDVARDSTMAPANVAEIAKRLLSTRTLFVLFDVRQAKAYRALVGEVLHHLGDQHYAFRTTREVAPLDFEAMMRRAALYQYDKPTVFDLSLRTIRPNLDYLMRPPLRGNLQRCLSGCQAYLIVPVPRSEVRDNFDELCQEVVDHVWHVRPPGNQASPGERTEAAPLRWQDAQLPHNTARFVVSFLPSLGQREFSATVETLLKGQSFSTMADQAGRQPSRNRFAVPAPPPPDPSTVWAQTQDNVLDEAGIVYKRGQPGQSGGYAFAEIGQDILVRELFLTRSRQWTARRFEALLDMVFQASSVSPMMQQHLFDLTQVLHDEQILEVDPSWLWRLFVDRVMPYPDADVPFFLFERLVHSLMRSTSSQSAVTRFLQDLAKRCQETTDDWLRTFFELDAVRTLGQCDADDDEAVTTAALHAVDVIEQLGSTALMPLRHFGLMHALLIRSLAVLPAITMAPVLLEACKETPDQRQRIRAFAKIRGVNRYARHRHWTMFLSLRAFFKQSPDLLCEFGDALLKLRNEAGKTPDVETVDALSVMLDALHQSIYDAARASAGQSDKDARRFVDYFVQAGREPEFAKVLARTCAMRSPPREWTLLADDPPLRGHDLLATISLYLMLANALLDIEGGLQGGVRARIQLLMKPLVNELDALWRRSLRQSLHELEARFRVRKTFFESRKDRKRVMDELRNIDVIRLMLAALP